MSNTRKARSSNRLVPECAGRASGRGPFRFAAERISIVGRPGAGKTGLALDLGRITGIPVYHMDSLVWRPGFRPAPRAECQRLCAAILGQPRFILEGGYDWSYPDRIAGSDLVLWLDLPPGRRFLNVLWRSARQAVLGRRDGAQGVPDAFGPAAPRFWSGFLRDDASDRICLSRLLANSGGGVPPVRLTSHRDVARFLAQVQPPESLR